MEASVVCGEESQEAMVAGIVRGWDMQY